MRREEKRKEYKKKRRKKEEKKKEKQRYGNYCRTPFQSDPIGGSKPNPGCSFNSFYLPFYLIFFFKNVTTRILNSTRMADLNRSPVYSDCFHLSYHNIFLCHFLLEFSITLKHFQMVGPQTFSLIQFVTKWRILPLQNDTQNNSSEFNSFVCKISHIQKK